VIGQSRSHRRSAPLPGSVCRAGAVAKLRLGDFQFDGVQFALRFQEKGGKSREIPVRHDLEGFIRAYLEAAGIAGEGKDKPLYRAGNARSGKLTGNAMDSRVVCDLVKRRLKDAGLPSRLSPHSARLCTSISAHFSHSNHFSSIARNDEGPLARPPRPRA